MMWKIKPTNEGWWLFYQGTHHESWVHVWGTSENRWAHVLPTLDEVFQRIKDKENI
jgi:hypothetical protein